MRSLSVYLCYRLLVLLSCFSLPPPDRSRDSSQCLMCGRSADLGIRASVAPSSRSGTRGGVQHPLPTEDSLLKAWTEIMRFEESGTIQTESGAEALSARSWSAFMKIALTRFCWQSGRVE